jgi:ATP-dependent Clp protease, protease subunit
MHNIIKIDPRIHFDKLSDLFDEPEVVRVTKFDEEALEDFEDDFNVAVNTGQPVVPVIIDSFGGSSYGLLGMISAIETSPIPVATIIASKAMSAGACLFAFGTEGYRYMHPHAWLMIHDVGGFAAGKVEEIKADTKQMDKLNKKMYKRLSEHLGHKPEYIEDLIKKHNHTDWYLSAKQAKKHNLANHLFIPKFEIEVKFDLRFTHSET